MLTAHHVNAFLVIAVCLLASAAAFWRAGAAGRALVAQLLALAQTLLVAQVALGLLLLSDHHRAADHLHYAYGTFALLAVLSPWLYAPSEPRARLLWFAVATLVAAALGVRAYMTRMRNVNPFLRNLALLALVALAIVVLNQETALRDGRRRSCASRSSSRSASSPTSSGATSAAARSRPGRARPKRVFYAAVALLVVDLGWYIVGRPSGPGRARVLRRRAAIAVYVGVRTWRDAAAPAD